MCTIGSVALCLLSVPMLASAQTDDIQLYDGEIAPPGISNLMIHQNFPPKGRTTPDYPGAIVANHSYQVSAEFAYGVTPWLEQGCREYSAKISLLYHRELEALQLSERKDLQKPRFYWGDMVRALGLEPRTNALKGRCSTN